MLRHDNHLHSLQAVVTPIREEKYIFLYSFFHILPLTIFLVFSHISHDISKIFKTSEKFKIFGDA